MTAMPTREALVEALETSMFLLPDVPGQTRTLTTFPGLRCRMTSVSYPLSNLVGLSQLTPENVDATLQQVRDLFARERKVFGWLLGPNSTPADLGQRLAAAGFVKVADMAGMALTDLQVSLPTPPDVHVRVATEDDLELASKVLAEAYPAPEDVCRQFSLLFLRHMAHLQARVYLAYVDGVERPVAYAAKIHLPDQPIVQLFSSATLPAWRHRGVYTSLVARRLADAHRDGARAAIVQAERATSAPICQQLGFTELGGLELHAWMPPTPQAP
jgi:N-acetylglutamate synthase-like GNAT family acetyltransferase